MLCKPTNVAAAICQALSPSLSQVGDGTSAMSCPFPQISRLERNGDEASEAKDRKNYASLSLIDWMRFPWRI
jgi:hypothetical protein